MVWRVVIPIIDQAVEVGCDIPWNLDPNIRLVIGRHTSEIKFTGLGMPIWICKLAYCHKRCE